MIFGRELVIGLVLGVAVAWAWRNHGHKVAMVPSWPVISYDKIGQALDWKGRPWNWTNPGR